MPRWMIQFVNPARSRLLAALLVCLLAAASGGVLRAAERVELANGFTMRCDHHALVQGRMRLYSDAGSGNFIEVAPDSVARFDAISEQPTTPMAAQPVMLSGAQPTPEPTATRQATTQPQPALNRRQLQPILASAGREHDLDVDLLASIVQAESANRPHAMSHAGAEGLMQLMPATAQTLGVRNAFAPEENVHGGAAYLDTLLARYHENLALALAAYNAGPAAVDRWHGIPPYRETRLYVARVIHLFNQRVMERRERLPTNRATLGNGQ